MPQADGDLRDLMKLMFGDPISDAGPTEFLMGRGYVLTEDWQWRKPNEEHEVTHKEYLCLQFMVDEWDYGGVVKPSMKTRDARQWVAADWGRRCFGEDHMKDVRVRAARFFEEASELVQAVGLPVGHAVRAMAHAYSRAVGDPKQEAGGVGVTLMMLCNVIGLSAEDAEVTEVNRVLSLPEEKFAERNKFKVSHVDQKLNQRTEVTDLCIQALQDVGADRINIEWGQKGRAPNQ